VIAEDEQTNYYLLESLLKERHAVIYHVQTGKEAVEYLEKYPPNENTIVLMDIRMPVMNGREAGAIIRKKYPDVKMIAVTAYAMPSEQEKIIKDGFDGIITKPIDHGQLTEMIKDFAQR
jgi:CheY-like chemotaxis protein